MKEKHRVALLANVPEALTRPAFMGRATGVGSTWLTQLAPCLEPYTEEFDFHWISLDKTLQTAETIAAFRQHFHRIPSAKITINLLLAHQPARFRLRAYLKKLNPHIIHVWGTEDSYPVILKDMHVPTLLSMQGVLTAYARVGAFKNNWRSTLQQYYERRWLPRASAISAESAWGIHQAQALAPGVSTYQVEYGVHPSFYQVPWMPSPAKPIFVYIGTLDYRKGMDVLLEALRTIEQPRFEIRIIGSGIYQDSLKSIPCVKLLGNLPWQEVQKHLSEAWALVLPTRADTSPNVAKEARVIGLPVITTPYGGQAGYIQHSENGWIIDPLTPQSLKDALQTFSLDFEWIRKLGKTHHERDRLYFRPEKTAESFIEIYQKLLQS